MCVGLSIATVLRLPAHPPTYRLTTERSWTMLSIANDHMICSTYYVLTAVAHFKVHRIWTFRLLSSKLEQGFPCQYWLTRFTNLFSWVRCVCQPVRVHLLKNYSSLWNVTNWKWIFPIYFQFNDDMMNVSSRRRRKVGKKLWKDVRATSEWKITREPILIKLWLELLANVFTNDHHVFNYTICFSFNLIAHSLSACQRMHETACHMRWFIRSCVTSLPPIADFKFERQRR